MKRQGISIVGVPMDLGAGRRGVDMGPSSIRVANLGERLRSLNYEVQDLGNLSVEQAESLPVGSIKARYLPQIAKVCVQLARQVKGILRAGRFPLVLGGDHSIAIGTIAGVADYYRRQGKRIGLIWIDAHPDMNTPETTPSGNVHGMPLACSLGMGPRELTRIYSFAPKVDPANVALVGVRDVDQMEKPHVRASGVRAFTMRHIDERGLRAVMEEAIEIASVGTEGFHVSLDLDVVDPQYAPGVGTPVAGGMTYREAHLAMEMICDSNRMVSMEVVEVNPVIDERNRTANLAVELVMSAMGKSIL